MQHLSSSQEIRKSRSEIIVASATTTRQALHLPDGPEQQMRDDAIGKASRGEGVNPDLWGDKSLQSWIWGPDIQQQTVDRFDDLHHEVVATKPIRPPRAKSLPQNNFI